MWLVMLVMWKLLIVILFRFIVVLLIFSVFGWVSGLCLNRLSSLLWNVVGSCVLLLF